MTNPTEQGVHSTGERDGGAVAIQEPLPLQYDSMNRPQASSFRWVVLTLVFLAITINYVDRLVMGILAGDLQKLYHISDVQYGYIQGAFALSYAAGQLASGAWLDRV